MLAGCAGFVLMVFELLAARMLAPTIGSSTYVWTSVIGVIILALSAGYWWGGKIADQRSKQSDIGLLWLMIAFTIATTAVLHSAFLQMVSEWKIDVRLAAVVASIVLFAPTSFLLGGLSPYLAKLNVVSLATSGSAVAHLGALNSLGGIVGTFFTGFVLFELAGIRNILTGLIIFCVALAWWAGLVRRSRNFVLSLVVFMLGMLVLPNSNVLVVDTASAHYTIQTAHARNGQEVRLLATGPGGKQSGVYVDAPAELIFWYTREIARAVQVHPQPKKILVLGGGAYTLPAYFAEKYPSALIDVVEIDPELAAIATKYFSYQQPKNVRHIAMDARAYVNRATITYDVIVVDAFGDDSLPPSLVTMEYGSAVSRIVAPGGFVVANILAGEKGVCGRLLSTVTRPYAYYFKHGYFLRASRESERSNIVVVFTDSERVPEGYRLLNPARVDGFTDDFNPVSGLDFTCKQQAKNA